jgi:hypothetical protein
VALLAVGTTIGAPTYGTYRLVKHIRNKRRASRLRHDPTTLSAVEGEAGNDDTDDELTRAIAASLESYKEETEKRDELLLTDSDDSFDDD